MGKNQWLGRLGRGTPVSLQDQVVIVTGASSGIGWATARAFAREGAKVVAAARRREELGRLVEEIEGSGGSARAVAVDVTRDEDLERLLSEALEGYGRLDVLVNNAGVAHGGKLHEQDGGAVRSMLSVNLQGTMRLSQVVLPVFLEQGSGHVVNVSSVVAYSHMPAMSVYSATKAGIAAFSSALRREVRAKGVSVSVVLPGVTRTPMIAAALEEFWGRPEGEQPLALRPLAKALVEPEVVAEAILDAVRWRSREVVVGGLAVAGFAFFDRVMPGVLDALLGRLDPEQVMAVTSKLGTAAKDGKG